MPRVPNEHFTPEQEKAFGEIVADNWGDNFQTGGRNADGCHVIYSQTGPNHPVKRFEIAPDGTVSFG